MPTETFAGNLGEIRGGTSTGVSLSTTAAYIPIPAATKVLFMTPRNLSTAVVARVQLCPWAAVLKTADAGATAATDYSTEAQDGSTSTSVTLSSLGTAAQGDFLYVGSRNKFRGVHIDIDSANATASVVTVKYWDGNSWEDITATDGTASGGAAMAVDGTVTWTVPTAWAPTSLRTAGDFAVSSPFTGNMYYWTRWQFSGGLDSSTTLDHLIALPETTNYLELVANQQFETSFQFGPDGYSSVVALTDAGTANLVVGYGAAGRF
jgi:hypothetical protein